MAEMSARIAQACARILAQVDAWLRPILLRIGARLRWTFERVRAWGLPVAARLGSWLRPVLMRIGPWLRLGRAPPAARRLF